MSLQRQIRFRGRNGSLKTEMSRNVNEELKMSNEFDDFLVSIRAKNILPTLFLSLTGGYIMNPSFTALLTTPKFLVSSLTTVLVMSISMIVNDLFDIETDKINNAHRPIASGAMSKGKAKAYATIMILICEALGVSFLPIGLQMMMHSALLLVNLYTPIFKKVTVLKNVICACIVSFAVFFAGMASSSIIPQGNPHFDLLLLACSIVFFGSWSNEIMMDIRDYRGDMATGIQTIPVIVGIRPSWILVTIILLSSVVINSFMLASFEKTFLAFLPIPLIMIPMFVLLRDVGKSDFTSESLGLYMNHTTKTLALTMILMCSVAYLH